MEWTLLNTFIDDKSIVALQSQGFSRPVGAEGRCPPGEYYYSSVARASCWRWKVIHGPWIAIKRLLSALLFSTPITLRCYSWLVRRHLLHHQTLQPVARAWLEEIIACWAALVCVGRWLDGVMSNGVMDKYNGMLEGVTDKDCAHSCCCKHKRGYISHTRHARVKSGMIWC